VLVPCIVQALDAREDLLAQKTGRIEQVLFISDIGIGKHSRESSGSAMAWQMAMRWAVSVSRTSLISPGSSAITYDIRVNPR